MLKITAALLAFTIAGAAAVPATAAPTANASDRAAQVAECNKLEGKAKVDCLKKVKDEKPDRPQKPNKR